jgi:hypothetical protein
MKEQNKILFVYILFLVCIILLASCQKYPVSQAVKDLNKAYLNYPDTTASKTRGWFPCTTTKVDTVVTSKDSIVYVDCPDLPEIITMPGSTDTIIKEKFIKVPFTLPVKYVTVTKTIEDSAKIKLMARDISEKDKVIAELKADNDKLKHSRNRWRYWCLMTWGVIILYFGLRTLLSRINYLK